jgi:hypothetical protein
MGACCSAKVGLVGLAGSATPAGAPGELVGAAGCSPGFSVRVARPAGLVGSVMLAPEALAGLAVMRVCSPVSPVLAVRADLANPGLVVLAGKVAVRVCCWATVVLVGLVEPARRGSVGLAGTAGLPM